MKLNINKLRSDIVDFYYMPDDFFKDILLFEISLNYYGEKLAKLFYKHIGNKKLEAIEKQHSIDFKNVIGELIPIDPYFFNFIKQVAKTRDRKNYADVINYIEFIGVIRYKLFLQYVEDEQFKTVVEKILQDEDDHSRKIKTSKYQTNFDGFENIYVFKKYSDQLVMPYQEFKQKMWNSEFIKKLRNFK
jgi:hypothetical protein